MTSFKCVSMFIVSRASKNCQDILFALTPIVYMNPCPLQCTRTQITSMSMDPDPTKKKLKQSRLINKVRVRWKYRQMKLQLAEQEDQVNMLPTNHRPGFIIGLLIVFNFIDWIVECF